MGTAIKFMKELKKTQKNQFFLQPENAFLVFHISFCTFFTYGIA